MHATSAHISLVNAVHTSWPHHTASMGNRSMCTEIKRLWILVNNGNAYHRRFLLFFLLVLWRLGQCTEYSVISVSLLLGWYVIESHPKPFSDWDVSSLFGCLGSPTAAVPPVSYTPSCGFKGTAEVLFCTLQCYWVLGSVLCEDSPLLTKDTTRHPHLALAVLANSLPPDISSRETGNNSYVYIYHTLSRRCMPCSPISSLTTLHYTPTTASQAGHN